MLMKRFLFLCLATLFSFFIFAEDETVFCFAIEYADGEGIDYFALSAEPVITYGAGTITVKQEGEDAYSIEDISLDDIKECYFEDAVPTGVVPEGIESVPTMDGSMAEFSNGQTLITGLKEGAQVYVYTADGQTVGSVTAQNGNACIDFNSLKGGQVYILHTPKASYKIVK